MHIITVAEQILSIVLYVIFAIHVHTHVSYHFMLTPSAMFCAILIHNKSVKNINVRRSDPIHARK